MTDKTKPTERILCDGSLECLAPLTYLCICSRCDQEGEDHHERFHSCANVEHVAAAEAKHERVREREARWAGWEEPDDIIGIRQHELAGMACLVLGANLQATNATTLGDKVYWRVLRDGYAKAIEDAGGGTLDRSQVGKEVLVLTDSNPHIIFHERDIELMRAAVAEYDRTMRDRYAEAVDDAREPRTANADRREGTDGVQAPMDPGEAKSAEGVRASAAKSSPEDSSASPGRGAPERVTLYPNTGGHGVRYWADSASGREAAANSVDYVRADIVAALLEALRPFAKYAECFEPGERGNVRRTTRYDSTGVHDYVITHDDFRRARDAFKT